MADDDKPTNDFSREQAEALAALPADLALIKIEKETIMAVAAKRPRDLSVIAKGLVAQVREFPGFAAQVLYSRPVGKDEESGKQKFATGLSIRAAEAIAEAYGACDVRSSIEELPNGNARVTATFTDYQRCRTTSQSIVVARTYKARSGKMVTHPLDRFLDVVCKAAQSKVIRDVIVRSVPPALKTTLELAVRTSVRVTAAVAEKIVAHFATLGVTQAEIETFLGAARSDWSDVHRQRLLEIQNALEEEETSVEDVFGARPKAKAPAEKPNGNGGSEAKGGVQAALENPVEVAGNG